MQAEPTALSCAGADDSQLLTLLQENPETGLWQLTERYGALITAVVRRILPRSPQDAEECVSDTLLRIWKNCSRITLYNGSIRGFVICTARSTAIDRYRHLKNSSIPCEDIELLEDVSGGSVTDTAEQEMSLATVEQAIHEMPPPDDEIFMRRFFLYETVPQIAKRLKLGEKAVESRLFRGKQKLRQILEKRGVTL